MGQNNSTISLPIPGSGRFGAILTPKQLAPLLHSLLVTKKFGGIFMSTSLCFFMFVTLIFSGKILAKEEIIATITNDENKEVYTFVADVDEQTDAILNFYKDDYLNGKKYERELLSTEGLSQEGMVLEQRGDHKVIALKSDNFDLEQGGIVTIDTLFSGVSGQRKAYDLQLAKSKEGWRLFKNNKIVSKLHIVINKKFLLGAVGVKDIVMK